MERSKRDRCINFNNRRKWKKAGTEKVLHNEYNRGSGRICKSGKKTLGNRKLSLDTGCDIQRRCKQDIEQKCGKKLKYSKEISNLNIGRTAVQKDGRELIGKMLKEEWNVTKDMMVLSIVRTEMEIDTNQNVKVKIS